MTLNGNLFLGNNADDGGAFYLYKSSVVANCNSFINNSGLYGGAITLDTSSITVNKDVFTGNTAKVSFFDSLNSLIYFSLLSFIAFLFLTALF